MNNLTVLKIDVMKELLGFKDRDSMINHLLDARIKQMTEEEYKVLILMMARREERNLDTIIIKDIHNVLAGHKMRRFIEDYYGTTKDALLSELLYNDMHEFKCTSVRLMLQKKVNQPNSLLFDADEL